MTDILLCGANGKMGQVIHSCVSERDDMRIVAGIDINTVPYDNFPICSSFDDCAVSADVIVDFSNPVLLAPMLRYAQKIKLPVVIATTGYSEEQVAAIHAAAENIAIFFTFNMSLGINLLVDLSKKAAAVLGDSFDIEIIEKHHNQKIDAPSGTAIMLANAINESSDERYIYEYDRHSKRQKRSRDEIGIHSVRGGTIVGEHEVVFAGRDEIVSLKHTAMSKQIFAVGAVNAAAFLKGKPAGLYSMKDMI